MSRENSLSKRKRQYIREAIRLSRSANILRLAIKQTDGNGQSHFHLPEEQEMATAYDRLINMLRRFRRLPVTSHWLTVFPVSKAGKRPQIKFEGQVVKEIFRSLSFPYQDIPIVFHGHSLHPDVEAYLLVFSCRNIEEIKFLVESADPSLVAKGVNQFREVLIELALLLRSKKYVSIRRNYQRNARECYRRLREFVAYMWRRRGRVLSLRMDLEYGKLRPEKFEIAPGPIELKDAKRHREKFQRHLAKTFSNGLLFFAWAMECGPSRGVHFHFWIVLDGAKYQKDMVIVERLGKHWKNTITEGVGQYFNCNAHGFYSPDAVGVGRLERGIESHELGIESIIRYLSKIDYHLRFDVTNARTFGTSILKKG
jgi:hypothetical protein